MMSVTALILSHRASRFHAGPAAGQGGARNYVRPAESTAEANSDDEHDPEGPTIAFERAHITAMIEQNTHRLAELDGAINRLDEGGYGICESCGAPIGAERLAARPAAKTCVSCASGRR